MPSLPALGREADLNQGPETVQTHPQYSASDVSRGYMEPPVATEPDNVHPVDTVDPILLHDGEGTLGLPSWQNSIIAAGTSPSPIFSAPVGSGPSGSSTAAHQVQVPPEGQTHRYQCTTCQKGFDRMSRLENCLNLHANEKPHQCFGMCGRPEWYALPFPLACAFVLTPFCDNIAQRGMDLQSSSRDISTRTRHAPPGEFVAFWRKFTESSQ
jgi:hypothetical protein